MKNLTLILFYFVIMQSCNSSDKNQSKRIVFLHHSTGNIIWNGNNSGIKFKLANKACKLLNCNNPMASIPKLMKSYNKINNTNHLIEEKIFPKEKPYGWHNYPYDYYNIWVKNGGQETYLDEPTLENLTRKYDIIILKHCFPASNIQPESESNVDSDLKSIANYKLQYTALKQKFNQFPQTKFLVWTGAAQVESQTNADEAKRAKEFFNWVVKEWDEPNDNIFIWDFYSLETEGNLFMKKEFAVGTNDSHPTSSFAEKASKSFFQEIIKLL